MTGAAWLHLKPKRYLCKVLFGILNSDKALERIDALAICHPSLSQGQEEGLTLAIFLHRL